MFLLRQYDIGRVTGIGAIVHISVDTAYKKWSRQQVLAICVQSLEL